MNKIKMNHRWISIHKTITEPKIGDPTVLVSNTWNFVDLYLKRENKSKARFFWQQAKHFYEASLSLPNTSAPLTLYYCFLNATKTLLEVKNITYDTHHGISGKSNNIKTTLNNEIIEIKGRGILPELAKLLDCCNVQTQNNNKITLQECFYNLPFLHRAFQLTYKTQFTDLFIPLEEPYIVKGNNGRCWFSAKLEENNQDKHILNKLPSCFEADKYKGFIRAKKIFKHIDNNQKLKDELKSYNKKLRKYLFYIHGNPTVWYIKRNIDKINKRNNNNITKIKMYKEHPTLVLMFCAMHRLSELSRYTPDVLDKHFNAKQNWLLDEFIHACPNQFIDEIASEITGLEFKIPKNSI